MSKSKNLPKILISLFFLTFILLTVTTVNGTRAALNDRVENNDILMTIKYIGLSLEESIDGEKYNEVSYKTWNSGEEKWDEGGSGLLSTVDMSNIAIDKNNDYRLRVAVNDYSTINEYVRVVAYKYWTKIDENGETVKDLSLNQGFINVAFNTQLDDNGYGWIADPTYDKNNECKVFYYNIPIGPEGNVEGFASYTSDFITGIGINSVITIKEGEIEKTISIKDFYKKTETKEGNKTITTYDYLYNGKNFTLKVEADAVQTHNAEKAIKSAWGVDVSIPENSYVLSLGGGN